MYRRSAAVFFVYCLFLSVLILHLGLIAVGEIPRQEIKSSQKGISLEPERANIFDCNNQKLTNVKESFYAGIKPTKDAAEKIRNRVSKKDFVDIEYNLKKRKPVIQKIDVPYIDSEDILVFPYHERYDENAILSHIIGYVNSDGDGVVGLEKSYNELLKNNSKKSRIIFPMDSSGNVLDSGKITFKTESTFSSSGVYLTIDKKIQQIAENCMDSGNIDMGAMVVIEPSTGKIKAMVSRPNFDPNNIGKSLNDKSAPFLNRTLTAFPVGSVFKPMIAACALEQNISPNTIYNCMGKTKIKNIEFGCYNKTPHGMLDMKGALEESCNGYFINLIQKMNMEETISTLKSFGFGREVKLCDGIISEKGVLPSIEELRLPAARANFSFGQGNFLATPLQISMCMSVFAEGGELHLPYLIEKTVDKDKVIFEHTNIKPKRVVSQNTADTIKYFLQSAVENGNARGAKLIYATSAGKTATAQTGVYKNGKEIYNTWFSGFFPVENPQYVVTVIKENGSLGASDCAPLFKMFADGVLSIEG